MNDAEFNNNQIRILLTTAEDHFNRGEWEQALGCFDRVLELDPENKAALDGRRKVIEKLGWVAEIRARLAEGQEMLDSSQYDRASQILNEAQDIGATNGVLEYHAEIRALRDRAQEALLWRGVVDGQLEQARRSEEKGNIDAAIAILRDLLPKLTANGQDELGQAPRATLNRLLLQSEVDDQLHEAQQAFEDEDFERASQIAEDLSVRYPDRADVKRCHDRFSSKWKYLYRQLQAAQESLAGGRLDDAVALLSQVRHNMPYNPNWQALWLRAYSSHGHALMAQARTALLQQDFAEADRQAAEAAKAFASVLEVFPSHEPSERATKELAAWVAMTASLQQVRRDERALQLDAAQGMLAPARVSAESAKAVAAAGASHGSAYADIEGMLNSIELRISTARQRLNDARTALRDGLAALEQKRIDRAEEYFRRGLDSLGDLPDDILEAELRRRRQQAIELRDANLRLLQEAQAQEEADKCIALLQQVYDAWPTAPGMPATLGDKLLVEAEAALGARQNERAAQCARQVTALALLPDDIRERAQNLLDQVDCGNQVVTAVSEARRRHRQATEGVALPSLDEYRAIGDLLAEAQGRARRNCNEKLEAVTAALAEIQPLREALEQAWPSIEQARAAQAQGDWRTAAGLYVAAAEAMGALCPAALQREAQDTERRATELQAQIDAAAAALRKTQAAYQVGESGKLGDIQWEALFTEISLCLAAIANSKKLAQPAPEAVSSLEAACIDLQTRARLLRDVFEYERSGKTNEALSTLKATAERFPNDTVMTVTLRVMREAHSAATRARADEILGEVDSFTVRGEWQNALDKLAQASDLELSPGEIERTRQRITRQQRIWDDIWEKQRQAEEMKTQNSRVDAQRAYSDAILLASFEDSGLDAALRTILVDLRSLFDKSFNPAIYGQQGDSLLAEARLKLDQASRVGPGNLLSGKFLALVKDWFDISVSRARFGFITSAESLNNHILAYEVAIKQLRETPGENEIEQKASELRIKIASDLESSLGKRIDRAGNNAERGNFEKALEDLATIDELLNPAKQFSEIVNTDIIQTQLQNATLMETKLLKLQQRAARLEPMLEAISKAYISGNLDEAERLIMEAEVIDVERSARYLWNQIDNTQILIRKRRQELTVRDLDELLARVRVRLDTDESLALAELKAEVLDPLEANLAKVRSLDKVQWGDRQQDYDTLLARTRERMRQLQEVELAWQTAQDYVKTQAWEEAIVALERCLSLARGPMREKIQREYEHTKPRAEVQRKRREDIEAGKRNLSMRRFTNAVAAFAGVTQLDASDSEIQPFLAAAHAGACLERARECMVTNPNEAERLLQDAIRFAADFEPAQEMKKEAQADLAQITKRQEHAARIAQLMRIADGALMEDKLKEAGDALDAILQLDQGHPSAQELRRKVNEALRAQTLLSSAADLYAKQRYREAIELADQSLKIYPLTAAQELSVKLHIEQDAGEALTRAQSLAQEGRFVEARRELQSARDKNPNHPGLSEAQQALSDTEEWFTTRVKKPVDDAIRQQKYRDALRAAENALKTVDLPGLKNDLEQRQQASLDAWARQLTSEAQALLNQPSESDSDQLLARCAEQLNEALSFAEAAPVRLRQELSSLVNKLEVRRSLLRLTEGQALLDAASLSTADLRRCEQIGRDAIQSNETLKDFELGWKAIDFQNAVEDRRMAITQAERDSRLEEARQQLARAKSAADLELARQRANEVLSLPNYTNDPSAKALQTQIDEESRRLRLTADRLENARRSLRNGNYSGAQTTLEMIEDPSRLLRDELARLIDLTADLIEAEDKEATDPQRAMEIYEAAEASGYDLGLTMMNARRRCRATALAQLEQDLTAMLSAATPDVAAAQQRLQQVRERSWAQTAEQEQRVAQLEALAGRKAWLVAAIELLEQGAQAEKAVKLLEEMRRSQPQGSGDAVDEGWLVVAQAVAALESGRLDEAQRLLHLTPPFLRQTALVGRVQADLTQAQQTAQQYSAAAAQLDQLLGGAAPDFAAAVQVARRLPANASLERRVRAALEQAIQVSGAGDNYRRVRELGEQLQSLLSADEAAGELLRQAEAQRVQKLEDALAAAEAALTQDDVDAAERLLAQAQKLDIDRTIPRIDALQQRLRQRQPVLAEMALCAGAAREAMRASDHRAAVTSALQAQRLAQQHTTVRQLFDDLRASIRTAIDQHVAANNYHLALQGCHLALELGPDNAFTALRAEVEARRRAAIDEAVANAVEALAHFDLESAQRAVASARTIQGDDARVERLERQLSERQQAAPKLHKAMEDGWDAMQHRNLVEAANQFRNAALHAPDFDEPQLWRNYAANIQQALAYVNQGHDEAAVNSLAQAETGLRYASAQVLSPLWGARLEQERRRAVYYALRLRLQVQEMINARRESDAAWAIARAREKDPAPLAQAAQLRQRLGSLLDGFASFAHAVFEPSPDFDATFAAADKPAPKIAASIAASIATPIAMPLTSAAEAVPAQKPEPPTVRPPVTEETAPANGPKPASRPSSLPETPPARPSEAAAPRQTAASSQPTTPSQPATPKREPAGMPLPVNPDPPVQESTMDSVDYSAYFGDVDVKPID